MDKQTAKDVLDALETLQEYRGQSIPFFASVDLEEPIIRYLVTVERRLSALHTLVVIALNSETQEGHGETPK